jgi:glutathione S-transferase
MLKLYCFPRSGNSREVKLVLAEKGIPFEPLNIRGAGFDKQSPDFLKASPGGKVPAIIDGGTYLCDAYRINEYLEKKYPQKPLLPKDEAAREAIRQWVAVYDKKLALRIGLLLIECLLKPEADRKEETKARLWSEITAAMGEVDAFLGSKPYFFGEYTLADISFTPHLAALHRVGKEIPADFKNLRAWLERVKARPNFSSTQE